MGVRVRSLTGASLPTSVSVAVSNVVLLLILWDLGRGGMRIDFTGTPSLLGVMGRELKDCIVLCWDYGGDLVRIKSLSVSVD